MEVLLIRNAAKLRGKAAAKRMFLVYNAVYLFDCKYVNIYLPVRHKIWLDVKALVTKFHDQLRRVFCFQLFVPFSSEGRMRSILNIYINSVITFAGKLKIQL